MTHFRTFFWSAYAFVFACQLAHGTVVLKAVSLPSVNGMIVGTAFSPDSSRLAIVRQVAEPGISNPRHTIQIVDLKTGQEVSHADVLNVEPPDLASNSQFLRYSPDGRYLLLATRGSDVLLILNAAKLQTAKRIVLHPESRMPLSGQAHRYFQSVVSLAVASGAGVFGVLTHDELQGNEIFTGSFSSGQIIKSWNLGQGRTSTELGRSALSLSDDGLRTAVSLLPNGNSFPKEFRNLRLYKSDSGEVVRAIRTDGLIGQIMLVPGESVFASRIDTPSLFSKKACIEKWSFGTEKLADRFCDQGRTVGVALGSSAASDRLAGFAFQIHKDFEGQIYAASGRVDVWNAKTGNLIAYSEEIPGLVSDIQMSPNGSWVMADQTLLQISVSTALH